VALPNANPIAAISATTNTATTDAVYPGGGDDEHGKRVSA
jgi:hypothetical protein